MQVSVAHDTLRADVFRLVAAVLILAAGVVACTLYAMRWKRADRSSLFFGLGATVYGVRLITQLDTLRGMHPDLPWDQWQWGLSFFVGIPFVLYFGSTMARAYPRVIRTIVAVQITVAIVGLATLALGSSMRFVTLANGAIGITLVAVLLFISIWPRVPVDREIRILRVALYVFGAFSLYSNMASVDLVAGSGRWEPIGLIFFFCCLGYVSAERTLRTEQRLVALDSELEIARQIQTGLLPDVAASADRDKRAVTIEARFVPAAVVAGDFYDVLRDGESIGVLVADVSGHGIPAALSASMVKIALHSQAEHMANPARVLSGVNAALCGTLRGQFVTAAYLFVDPANNTLRYAAAGHPPMLLWRAKERRVEAIEENGLLMGPFAHAQYSTVEVKFESGDRCVLYTDGVLEAENAAGEGFGLARLTDMVTRTAGASATVFLDCLLSELSDWTGTRAEAQDDITVVVLELTVTAQSLRGDLRATSAASVGNQARQ